MDLFIHFILSCVITSYPELIAYPNNFWNNINEQGDKYSYSFFCGLLMMMAPLPSLVIYMKVLGLKVALKYKLFFLVLDYFWEIYFIILVFILNLFYLYSLEECLLECLI